MLEVKELSLATVDDLAANPHKYGLPTMEEYAQDPERFKMLMSADDFMAQIDRGSQTLSRHVTGHEYWVGPYKCDSLEQAERILKEHGQSVTAQTFEPDLVQEAGGKYTVKVKFKLPDE